MPKIPDEKNEVTLLEIKELIRDAIKSKYGMNVQEFVNSKQGQKLGVTKSLGCYLSPTGSTSFSEFKKLAANLGLGTLEKKIAVVKTVTYYL